ncbi:unnamed protein product [Rhodiola kirilowii]
MNVLKPNASKKRCLENGQQGGGEHIEKESDTVPDPICTERNSRPVETEDNDDKQLRVNFIRVTAEKIFASLAIIKAYYVLFQLALFPYNADLVQHSDEVIVNEFGSLSSLQRDFRTRRRLEFHAEEFEFSLVMSRQLSACINIYKALVKELELQTRSKDFQITLLRQDLNKKTALSDGLLSTAGCSGSVSVTEEEGFQHLRIMKLSYFSSELHHTIRSIRHFVKLMVNRMRLAGWDLDAAAEALQPGLSYWGETDICFAFEAYICHEMFELFHLPNFGLSKEPLPHPKSWRRYFAQKYLKLKSIKGSEYLSKNSESELVKFFRKRYQRVINPKMELSFFGNINFRNHIKLGGFPEAPFVDSFLEMARRVLRLHYLALSMDPNASVFQVPKGSHFSEIYMESVHEDPFLLLASPQVAFTVVPGFKLCQTIIQCQVYLSKPPETL